MIDRTSPTKRTKLALAVLVACMLLFVAIVVDLWLSPVRTMRAGHYFAAWPLLGATLFIGGRLLRDKLASARFRRTYGLAVLFFAVLAPLYVISPIDRAINTHAVGLVSDELRNLVLHLTEQPDISGAEIIEHLEPSEHVYDFNLQLASGQFLVATGMTAIDIDGYTVYRFSGDDDWRYFHNDQPEDMPAREHFNQSLATLRDVPTPARTAICRSREYNRCTNESGVCVENEHWTCRLQGDGW